MPGKRTIKSLLYETIHRNHKTIDQIADELGKSPNTLYRYCLEGESGSDMPLRMLVPLMKSTKNYSVLKHLAMLCGFLLVKVPTVRVSKGDYIDILDDYQNATSSSIHALKQFFNNPDFDTFNNAKDSLQDVMEKCAANTKYVEKVHEGQLELELEK